MDAVFTLRWCHKSGLYGEKTNKMKLGDVRLIMFPFLFIVSVVPLSCFFH